MGRLTMTSCALLILSCAPATPRSRTVYIPVLAAPTEGASVNDSSPRGTTAGLRMSG
ncbi:hypothetical protein JDO7802_01338 [Jannaschia donghaensis]|uniref:Uncharacterized protein n=1 Tax=Jannaschia donghaensis TaxID=420998 RepID=A0A0M6YI20_9RHOB|nr:hypothetical protein JDO7802_01338 [Jannaschia donghaensis]